MKTSLSSAELEHYTRLISRLLEESRSHDRPARGAWLKAQLLHQEPDFSEARWGFRVFREFLESLPSFSVTHDASDIVVELNSSSGKPSPTISALSEHEERLERVSTPLWRALTRHPTKSPNAFLDKTSLSKGQLDVKYSTSAEESGADKYFESDPSRFLPIPVVDRSMQIAWMVDWAFEHLSQDTARQIKSIANSPEGFKAATDKIYELKHERSWYDYRSAKTLEWAKQWAKSNGLAWASPLLQPPFEIDKSSIPRREQSSSRSDLREHAKKAIDQLTESEIRSLLLPFGVVFDLLKK